MAINKFIHITGKSGKFMTKHITYLVALFGSLIVNIVFLSNGSFSITQHLYYIPILLGVFFYERKGIYLAGLTSSFYLLSVIIFDHQNYILIPTIVRCIIFITIAILVSSLVERNHAQEKELMKDQKWLDCMLRSIGDGIIGTDDSGIIRFVNKQAEIITGYSGEELCGKYWNSVCKIFSNKDNTEILLKKNDLYENGGIFYLGDEIYTLTKDGIKKDLDVKASAIILSPQETAGFEIVFRDITEKNKHKEEIIYLTYHDKLTGLYNRRFFEEEVQRLDVERNLPISVIIGDVNGLKLTNDAFGHLLGDDLLVTTGNVIKEVCRDDDIIARWGGDEYIILLPHTDTDEAEQISERIRVKCGEKYIGCMNLSISLGVGTKRNLNEDFFSVIKQADDLMYRSKAQESRSIKGKAVQSILNALLEKNESEAQHSLRVSEWCRLIGQALNLDKRQIEDLALLGKIHDIGKAATDEEILNKKGKLTPEEYEVVKQHSEKGYNIVGASPELSYLAGLVLSHHEKWDGTGYPNGLKGQNIPFMARILSVADAYDAMTSDRPYRNAMSEEKAIEQLKEFCGTQFDPEIVNIFIQKVLNDYTTRFL